MERELTCRKCNKQFVHQKANKLYCHECCLATKKEQNSRRIRKKSVSGSQMEKMIRSGKLTPNHVVTNSTSVRDVCHMIDAGKEHVLDIEVPPPLSSWELFLNCYEGGMGKAIKFIKKEDRWVKQKDIEDWSVQQWSTWYNGYKNVEEKTEAYYLMDVPIQSIHSQLLQNKNPLVEKFSFGGQFCFSRYVKMYSEDVPIPDLNYKAFIAPHWGQIMTYPHKDGHGTQLSIHCCIIGSGYNLVHCWPKLNMGQERDFRTILNIPQIGSKQEISHDIDYEKGVDSSSTTWDVELAEELAKKGIANPTRYELHPGQAIILPPDQYHCFKKIHNEQATMPLVGIACDCAYVGSTKESFLQNYTSMKGLQKAHPWSDHIYCILELCLYCLFQSLVAMDPSERHSDGTIIAHARGAFSLFSAWVEQEIETEKQIRKEWNIQSPLEMMVDFDQDITCSKCTLPLVNLFCHTTEEHPKRYCIDCLKKVKKRTNLALMCRLRTPELLLKLSTIAKSILDDSSQEEEHFNQNEQPMSNNPGKKRKMNRNMQESNKKPKNNPDTSSNVSVH